MMLQAREMLFALLGCLRACDELMTEFVSKKRAAQWGIINDGLWRAEQLTREIRKDWRED